MPKFTICIEKDGWIPHRPWRLRARLVEPGGITSRTTVFGPWATKTKALALGDSLVMEGMAVWADPVILEDD